MSNTVKTTSQKIQIIAVMFVFCFVLATLLITSALPLLRMFK